MSETIKASPSLTEIPTVDWSDLNGNRQKFMDDLHYALS